MHGDMINGNIHWHFEYNLFLQCYQKLIKTIRSCFVKCAMKILKNVLLFYWKNYII